MEAGQAPGGVDNPQAVAAAGAVFAAVGSSKTDKKSSGAEAVVVVGGGIIIVIDGAGAGAVMDGAATVGAGDSVASPNMASRRSRSETASPPDFSLLVAERDEPPELASVVGLGLDIIIFFRWDFLWNRSFVKTTRAAETGTGPDQEHEEQKEQKQYQIWMHAVSDREHDPIVPPWRRGTKGIF